MPEYRQPPAGDGPCADVGVLLVHGIGDHAEGETLLGFGEPLIDWLREWMAGRRDGQPRGKVSVGETRLRARRNEAESPAYTTVEIEQAGDAGGPARERWLFAESWWGDSVHPPSAAALLTWMFTRLPLLVVWHFFGGHRDESRPVSRLHKPPRLSWDTPVPAWAGLAGKAVIAPLLILVLQAVVIVAGVLALVPFGAWRQALLSAVRVMTLTLGDSYVLLEQDIQRAALADRVARSLQWLQLRAGRVIVVAHSQGGAIAHDALQQGAAADLFISVGSGLEKLEFLRLVRNGRRGIFAGTVAAPAGALGLAGLVAGLIGWLDTDPGWWVLPSGLMLFAYFTGYRLWDVIADYRKGLEQHLADSVLARPDAVTQWCDVYATLDLVPMGEASLLPRQPNIERVELRNECSLLVDHVSYFDSRCGFASWCWATMAAQSRLALIDADERAALHTLGLWHARRAFSLGFGGALAPLAIVFGTLVFTDAMAAAGLALLDTLTAADMGWTRRALEWSTNGLSRAIGLLPGLANGAADIQRRGGILLAASAFLVIIGLWSTLTAQLWRADGRARWRAVCRGTSTLTGANAVWFGVPMVLFWCITAMLPLLGIMLVSLSPEAFTLGGLGRAMARVVAGMLAVVGLFCGLAPAWLAMAEVEEHLLKRRWHPFWPLYSALGMGLYGWLASLAWQVGSGSPIDQRLLAGALLACAVSWLLALSLNCSMPAWRLVLLWFGPLVVAGLTPTLAAVAGPVWTVLPGSAAALAIAGVLRWWAMRSRPGPN